MAFCYDESSFAEIFRIADNPFTAEYIMSWPKNAQDFEQALQIHLNSGGSVEMLFGHSIPEENMFVVIEALMFMAPNMIKTITWTDHLNGVIRIAVGTHGCS